MLINVILQARLSSTRLPGKVLKKIVNKPMLALQLERVHRSKLVNKIIVATSTEKEDDAIINLCEELNIPYFRGSLDDVLGRYYHAAKQYACDHIVRLTGDCPLIDPEIIDKVIALHLEKNADYTSNCLTPCLPDGLDVEIFTNAALAHSFNQAKKPSEREHVTQYIRNHAERFIIENYRYEPNLSEQRWTVDEPNDFELVKQIYNNLYHIKTDFTLNDVLTLLTEQPHLKEINNQYNRNQGLEASIVLDKELGFDK